MASNSYVEVSTTTGGNTARNKPMHFEDVMKVMPEETPVLSIFDQLRVAGRGRKLDNQTFTSHHEWPLEFALTVTAAAAAGANDITVDDTSMVKLGHVFLNTRTNERVRLTSDPTDGTSLNTVERSYGNTAAAAMNVGDTLIATSRNVAESWARPTAVQRATDSHDDYVSTIIHSAAISWHNEQQAHYGIRERARVEAQAMLEWKKMQNRALILNEPVAPSGSSTAGSNSGLLYYGMKYNHIEVPEGLTLKTLFKGYELLRKFGGGRRIHGLCGNNLVAEFALWGHNAGIVRSDIGQNENVVGFNRATVRNPHGVQQMEFITDYVFDYSGLDDKLILINFDLLELAEFGQPKFEKDIQDNGTGDSQWSMVRAIGLHNKLPIGSVLVFDNVKYIAG